VGAVLALLYFGVVATEDYLAAVRPVAPTMVQGTVVSPSAFGQVLDKGQGPIRALTLTIVSSDTCSVCVARSPEWSSLVTEAIGFSGVEVGVRLVGLGGTALLEQPARQLRDLGVNVSTHLIDDSRLSHLVYSTGIRTTPSFFLSDQNDRIIAVAPNPSSTNLARWIHRGSVTLVGVSSERR